MEFVFCPVDNGKELGLGQCAVSNEMDCAMINAVSSKRTV